VKYVLLGLVLLYAGSLCFGMPVAWPFDALVNAGPVVVDEALRVPNDGKRRVVVLQHGLWRSSWALLRLQRTLEAHGFEVWNLDYPSTTARIEDHAARLHDGVEAVFAKGPVDELSFVGHSLGGLVIEEYLRSPKARKPVACVYIATPHRGAMLCDLRKNWFLFRLAMGSKAALQLSPGDPFHQQPLPLAGISGAIVGDLGDCNRSIPGHDDGTVAVGEAALPGALATVTLPCGHTALAYDPETARQVLTFLRTRAFAPVAAAR
jgi:pimeloyl-ACP methyl ester carboxylesterase